MRMNLNRHRNPGVGDFSPARFTEPENIITRGLGAVSTLLSGLGAFGSSYDVMGYPILGPYDRIFAAIERQKKAQAELNKSWFDQANIGLNPETNAELSGLGDFSPARFSVPQDPITTAVGLAGANHVAPTPGLGRARMRNNLGAIRYGGAPGLGCGGGCGGGVECGCGMGMGDLSEYLPDMPAFLQGTVMGLPAVVVYGGGALLAYVLLSRGSGYRDEKAAARDAYRRRVRKARGTYKRGYQRGVDAYREAVA